MENKKTMDRPDIIYALARYACPAWYPKLIGWKTEHLKSLLEWYQRPEEVEMLMGIDFGYHAMSVALVIDTRSMTSSIIRFS